MDVQIRWEEQLPDDYVVLRGSKMAPATLWVNYLSVHLETGLEAICVGAGPPPIEAVAFAMPYRGDWVCESSVGVLANAGFEVYLIDDANHPSHAVVILKETPTGADWNGWGELREQFGSAIPNPAKVV